jgi:hypothetical protein
MAINEVESYRETQDEYERDLAAYHEREAAYRARYEQNPNDPGLPTLYQELEAMRLNLNSRYGKVSQMRDELIGGTSPPNQLSP